MGECILGSVIWEHVEHENVVGFFVGKKLCNVFWEMFSIVDVLLILFVLVSGRHFILWMF